MTAGSSLASLETVCLAYNFNETAGVTIKEDNPPNESIISFQQLVLQRAGSSRLFDDNPNVIYVAPEKTAYFLIDSPDTLEFILQYHKDLGKASTIIVRTATKSNTNTSPIKKRFWSSTSSKSVDELVPTDVAVLDDGRFQIKVDAKSLVRFLRSTQSNGNSIFQKTIDTADQKGTPILIDFTSHELWYTCFCEGGHAESAEFRKVFMEESKAIELHNKALGDLKSNHPDAWNKILFFARDLYTMRAGSPSEERLDAAQLDSAQHFTFSSVHFGSDLGRILDIPGPQGPTLRDALKYRYRNVEGGVVCTSHSLFPFVCNFFGLEKNFWVGKSFPKLYGEFEKTWAKERKRAQRQRNSK